MALDPADLNFRSRDFVHLHLHTDYSLLQAAIQLKPLAKRLAELEMRACAITDYGNMYGAVSFYNTMKGSGIHPIVGYEAIVTTGSRFDRGSSVAAGERPYYHLVLLAKDFEGYQNLVWLASKAFTEGFHHKPRIDFELLAERSKGLVALSSGFDGFVCHHLRSGNESKALEYAGRLTDIFGRDGVYLEIQDHGLDEQRSINRCVVELSKKTGLPLVATNDAHYLTPEDSAAHDVLVCIGEGRTLDRNAGPALGSRNFYVRSADEMWAIFGDELPEALKNTCRIAEMCRLKIPTGEGNLTLPTFPIPVDSGCSTTDEYFEKVVRDGFAERERTVWQPMQAAGMLKYDLDTYHKRLQIELDTIRNMGFPGYFLIVWEFINYAKQKGIPVGPGRGSAAGSLAAYCMQITDVDPIQYDLLFERFLNPERVSMPDIDIDFCIRGRGDVINHVTEFYGRESVCQIITFGTMASKAAIKDVGRALEMPLRDVERIAKLIPPPFRGRNISISQALEQVPELASAFKTDPAVKELVDLALQLEGCSRHTSVHAAGVVISPKPLHEIVPVAVSAKSELTSQYTMGDLEKVGMLKMDFLALTTLTIIDDCLKTLKEKKGVEIEWSTIPLNDPETMKLFGEGRTEAIFQFESSGMQEICRRLKPKELEDLAALNALYRPGPLDGGMIDDYIARHHGKKKVTYLVPQMEDILKNTFGVLVYQEQIMQLAQKLAGYSLGDADLMRRAMGKKKREEMAVHEEKFISGAVERGIPKAKAEEIFRLMAQFADYGFNRSHSIAYAYLAFQTAYLKAHYPSFFYAAVLSHEAQDSSKVYKYTKELMSIGMKLLPPDVNESDDGFTPLDDAVRFGLTAIKGIGQASVVSIIEARKAGPFTSVFDFVSRVEPASLNRRALESLITAGALDSLMPEEMSINRYRALLFNGIAQIMQIGQRSWEDRTRGQSGLFAMAAEASAPAADVASLPPCDEWSQGELSKYEKSALGFYLAAHPLDTYEEMIAELKLKKLGDYEQLSSGDTVQLAGLVSGFQVRYSKKGNRFCMFRLEDQSGGIKCIAWGETFSKFSDLLRDDEVILATGRIEGAENQDETLILDEIKLLADVGPMRAKEATIILPRSLDEATLEEIFKLLSRQRGDCGVSLKVEADGVCATISPPQLRIKGSSRLARELEGRGCSIDWVL
ncbi:MAG: DNA polymerase III subunit alpha [Pyrinomonadaceae bacterium]